MTIGLALQRRPIVLVVRPVDEVCNLACTYCNATVYNQKRPRLPLQSLKKLIWQASQLDYTQIQFVWHGGEPLVAGRSYFEHAISFQKTAFSSSNCNSKYENVVQTNGLLLDDQTLDLFQQNEFWIGLSLDGPDVDANHYRFPLAKAERLLQKTIGTIRRVVRRGLSVLVIGVVHDRNAHRAAELYDFYSELGVSKISFNPRFLRHDHDRNVDCGTFFQFLVQLSKARTAAVNRGRAPLEIGILDDLMNVKRGMPARICFFNNSCHKFFNVNARGEIYASCTDALGVRLGDLENDTLKHIVDSFSESPVPAVAQQLGVQATSDTNPIGPGCPKYSNGAGDQFLPVYRRLMAYTLES